MPLEGAGQLSTFGLMCPYGYMRRPRRGRWLFVHEPSSAAPPRRFARRCLRFRVLPHMKTHGLTHEQLAMVSVVQVNGRQHGAVWAAVGQWPDLVDCSGLGEAR
jgi:hypothetical protein